MTSLSLTSRPDLKPESDELAKATRADLRLEALPGLADTWVLSVTGK